MPIRRRFAPLLALALAAAAPPLLAQEPAPPAAPAAQEASAPATPPPATAEPATTPGASPYTGVPRTAQPAVPRTLRAYWHVFIAFAITWLLLFGYALSLARRLGRLEERLAAGPHSAR